MQFQREVLTGIILDEAMPLLKNHWLEISHYLDIPLNPDREFYLKAEASGMCRLFTVRSEEGSLLGYSVFFVKTNVHYKDSLQASQDILYLDPSLRKAMNGYRFIKYCDEELQKEGVHVVYHHVKLKHNFGPMLERLGYEPIDVIYGRKF